MRRPIPIAARIETRRNHRSEQAEAILLCVSELKTDAEAWRDDCQNIRDVTTGYEADAHVQGSANGGFAAAGLSLRTSLPKLVSLGHDIEVVVPVSSIVQQLGLRLDQIVPRIEHQLGRGVFLTIEQDGQANLVYASGPECLVTLPDHATLNIPIVLKISEQETRFNLNVSFAIRTLDPFHRQFQIFVSRKAHICPPADIDAALLEPLLSAVDMELQRFDSRIVDVGALPDLGSVAPDPYAGRIGNLTRLHFSLSRRSRRPVAPLAALPSWADIGIKVVPEPLYDLLRAQVAGTGFRITGISHPQENVIDVGAFREIRYTKRILKIDFGVRVRVNATLRCLVSVSPSRNMRIGYRSTSIKTDVDILPFPPGLLAKAAEELAQRLIRDFIDGVEGEEFIQLPSSRRTEISVTSGGLRLFLKRSFG